MDKDPKRVLVLFSGGQDSTTCLYWAIDKFGKENVDTLNIWYGQRHEIELKAAKIIALEIAKVKYIEFKTSVLQDIGDSALLGTGDLTVSHKGSDDLPASFVPGRNILFLTIASAISFKRNISDIVIGVCQTDYSGYPDCRDNVIKAMQVALSLGMGRDFNIHTPLMYMTKAETVKLAESFEGCFDALSYSITCYEGKSPPCGQCPSCKLRKKGFEEACIVDPIYRQNYDNYLGNVI